MNRHKLSQRQSKSLFKNTAKDVHPRNLVRIHPMRGGYRI